LLTALNHLDLKKIKNNNNNHLDLKMITKIKDILRKKRGDGAR